MAIFNDRRVFISALKSENQLSAQDAKFFGTPACFGDKYMGTKLTEVSENDIRNNLIEWAVREDSVYYSTNFFIYIYTLVHIEPPIIEVAMIDKKTYERWDSWMNVHSCSAGREWLKLPEQRAKQGKLLDDADLIGF